ncbi:MAG: metallophosphoesterase family protein [Spirochaetes bacterium]|nr:metallophosphoesterase family protein [Spirochaetota bacterium]
MKIFALSDIHGETRYFEAAAEMMRSADLVVISGDITKSRDEKSTEEILSRIELYAKKIVAVHGNWDHEDAIRVIEKKGYSVHGKGKIIDGIGFFGVGGSSHTPMNTVTEYTEEEISDFIMAGYRMINGAARYVLVTHTPPRRVRDRTFIGLRGGSRAVREFLDGTRVDLCLTGHIHEAVGVESLNGCTVVNSGSFKKGRYSLIEMESPITVEQGKL